MTIHESVVKLGKQYLDGTNHWYNWREINHTLLPQGIKISGENQYTQNIELKKSLHATWMNETTYERRGDLIEYYIKVWGGIKKNSGDSMKEYRSLSPNELIGKGIKGIASWSKALVVHDYNTYAIFDARVSCSLNALQIIYPVKDKILYPILASQNKKIIAANKILKSISRDQNWSHANELTFYNEYMEVLRSASRHLNTDISTVEMLLFAQVGELIKEAPLL